VTLEPQPFLEGPAKLPLAPAGLLEKARPFGGSEPQGSASRFERSAPAPIEHREQARRDEVDDPPPEARHRMQVAGEGEDVLVREVDEEALAQDERALRSAADAL